MKPSDEVLRDKIYPYLISDVISHLVNLQNYAELFRISDETLGEISVFITNLTHVHEEAFRMLWMIGTENYVFLVFS